MAAPADELTARLGTLTIADRHRLGRRLENARRREGAAGGELARLERAIDAAEALRAARAASVPAVTYPADLPVSLRRDDLLAVIAANQVVVVAGETGSGKTTQLPKLCLELGRGVEGMVGHTQPRRIAARTVAERLADELGVPLGGVVGYAVRFDDTVGETTLVKVMTDGILLAEIRRDRLLNAYDTVIVDEAHERSLNIDFLLGYLRELLPRRRDLKVLITSATIDTARFAAHFDAPVVEVSGRTYPVELRYRPLREDAPAEEARPGEAAPGVGDERPAGERPRGRRRRSDAIRAGRGAEAERQEAEPDVNQAICEAVRELIAAGPGDVLVFLPGERDIRDAAEALRNDGPESFEILPLYARLSAAEQHRVFRGHHGRRVVLATNVAETSLTVPGIRFVVDTGLARISRYSHRTKVQRLPIEAISKASADQRAGRCGRVAPGICIRLYSEQDYLQRREFTDPEILRTNLASVILQMAAIGLGEVEQFPFVEPPDARAIADGRALLEELGAFERHGGRMRLTASGRRLAQLPLDPRLGRMVLEAERLGCLREVTVVAAALSIQDPREHPLEHAQAAEEMHRRFAVAGSDFLTLVALWDYVAGLQRELSGNQLRKRLRGEYLSVLRVREWQDVASQIRQSLRSSGAHANAEPAHPDHVHQALLSGLLSQLGMRDRARGDYLGARGTRWLIGRGSVLSRGQPPWAMAGELVETERTFARTVAQVDPAWAERLGAHLAKRSYGEALWDPRRGEALTTERVTLYGLPIVPGRRVRLAAVDPDAAREMFVQRGLVEADWAVELPPFVRTDARRKRIAALESRVRRHGLLASDEALFEHYDSVVPPGVTSGRELESWWRSSSAGEPDLLVVPFSVLLEPGARSIDLADYPDSWRHDGLELAVRYRWEPGTAEDGVTVEVPLVALGRLDPQAFDWQVPGWRHELVSELIRSLPKVLRRSFVPVPDVAREVLERCGPQDGPLLEAVARVLALLAGVPVSAADFDLDELPEHLRVRFEIHAEHGRLVGAGRDLERLLSSLRGELRLALRQVAPQLVRSGSRSWDFGDLPALVERGEARAYPSLVDEGGSVGVELFESAAAQAEQMWLATRRLLVLAAPVQPAHLQRRLANETKLALLAAGRTPFELGADCAAAVADRIVAVHGGPVHDAASYAVLEEEARRQLVERTIRVTTIAGAVLAAAAEVEARAAALERADRSAALQPAVSDVRRQLTALTSPGFVTAAGTLRLRDLLRYLEAARRRLARLPADLHRDLERQSVLGRLEAAWLDVAAATAGAGRHTSGCGESEPKAVSVPPRRPEAGGAAALVGPLPLAGADGGAAAAQRGDPLVELRYLLEELRVSLWAQDLGTASPVSEERIVRALRGLAG